MNSTLPWLVCLWIIPFLLIHSALSLTFTSRRVWIPDTYCFIFHCARNGGLAYHWEVRVTAVGDEEPCVEVFISTIVPPIADGWRRLTLGNWDEWRGRNNERGHTDKSNTHNANSNGVHNKQQKGIGILLPNMV